jgi:hypothetical protein
VPARIIAAAISPSVRGRCSFHSPRGSPIIVVSEKHRKDAAIRSGMEINKRLMM